MKSNNIYNILKKNARTGTAIKCTLLSSFCMIIIMLVYKNNLLRPHGK